MGLSISYGYFRVPNIDRRFWGFWWVCLLPRYLTNCLAQLIVFFRIKLTWRESYIIYITKFMKKIGHWKVQFFYTSEIHTLNSFQVTWRNKKVQIGKNNNNNKKIMWWEKKNRKNSQSFKFFVWARFRLSCSKEDKVDIIKVYLNSSIWLWWFWH